MTSATRTYRMSSHTTTHYFIGRLYFGKDYAFLHNAFSTYVRRSLRSQRSQNSSCSRLCSTKFPRQKPKYNSTSLEFAIIRYTESETMASNPIDMGKIIPLVTGGGTGIGWGLVVEFLKRGSPKVLITGRREVVLKEAAEKYPGQIFYLVNDAGRSSDREALLAWLKSNHPDCNALVNNAGILHGIAPALDTSTWEERAPEIEVNFAGPVHLCSIFIPWFLSKANEDCLVANVSSILAFVPLVQAPVYSATKAALHNYTAAMRYSLEGTNVRMIEIIPPPVKTDMGPFGDDCDVYCAATMDRLEAGEPEIGFNSSETMRLADRAASLAMMDSLIQRMNTPRFPSVEKNTSRS